MPRVAIGERSGVNAAAGEWSTNSNGSSKATRGAMFTGARTALPSGKEGIRRLCSSCARIGERTVVLRCRGSVVGRLVTEPVGYGPLAS